MSTKFSTILWVLFISNFANVGNYIFQIFLGRNLSPSDFGTFNTIAGLGLLIGFFAPVIPNVVSKFLISTENDKNLQEKFRLFFLRRSFCASLVITALMILGAPLYAHMFQVPSTTPIIIFSLAIGSMVWMMYLQGILTTQGRYVLFSSHLTAHTAIKVSLVVVSILFFSGGYYEALWAVVISNLIIILSLIGFAKAPAKGAFWRFSLEVKRWRYLLLPKKGYSLKTSEKAEISKFFIPATMAQLVFTLMINIDIVLVQAFAGAKEAGIYSFAAILARVAIFLPQMLLSVLFPEIVRNQDSRKILNQTMALTLLTSGGYWLFLFSFKEPILHLVFGSDGVLAAPLIGYITFAMVLFSVTNILFQKNLAKDLYGFLWPSVMTIACLLLAGGLLSDKTALGMAKLMMWLNVALLFVVLFWEHYGSKEGKKLASSYS